jgi:biopolymer transport protein ExbD
MLVYLPGDLLIPASLLRSGFQVGGGEIDVIPGIIIIMIIMIIMIIITVIIVRSVLLTLRARGHAHELS